ILVMTLIPLSAESKSNLESDRRHLPGALVDPALAEELTQQVLRPHLAQSAIDVRSVMTGRLREESRPVIDAPHLLVARRKIEAPQAGEGDRGGAHGARLGRHIEVAADKPFAAERRRRLANGYELGMRRRVLEFERAISGSCHDIARLIDNDTA